MTTTPAAKKRNDPQTVLKNIDALPPESVIISVAQKVNASGLRRILSAIDSFVQGLGEDEEYHIDIGLIKLKKIEIRQGDQDA